METEWQNITKVLNLQKRKRKYDLRMIWNAIFYLVKTGCQWRILKKEGTKLVTPFPLGLALLICVSFLFSQQRAYSGDRQRS